MQKWETLKQKKSIDKMHETDYTVYTSKCM